MKNRLVKLLKTEELLPTLPEDEARRLAKTVLNGLCKLQVHPSSIASADHCLFCLGQRENDKFLVALSEDPDVFSGFEGKRMRVDLDEIAVHLCVGPTSRGNATALREVLPFLRPRVLGLAKSAGCGDRLGLATPAHIRALRRTHLAAILAQQSVRENDRTGRSPQMVLDDALWGVFQEGWRGGYGADADHLKTTEQIDDFVAAGYTFYTIDPGDHLDQEADEAEADLLLVKFEALPWGELESTPADLERSLTRSPIDLDGFKLQISKAELMRAAAKYGRVLAHTVEMYRHLVNKMADRPFELEVSVDETESVTTLAEHVYLATELKRLGVKWVSLAPRYVGRFEKGVDYIGDLALFEESLAGHAAIARTMGPYKLSIHSGSDKFSLYPIFSKLAGELVHLKTAGTSYLEALRTIARVNPLLFRQIVSFALDRYPHDRATYHVSADGAKAPNCESLADLALPELLDDFHARQILHVTYGSVLGNPRFKGPFFDTLIRHEEIYAEFLETHFDNHFRLLT